MDQLGFTNIISCSTLIENCIELHLCLQCQLLFLRAIYFLVFSGITGLFNIYFIIFCN